VEPELGFIAEARRAPTLRELDECDGSAHVEWAPHTSEWEPYVITQRTAEGDPSGWELRHLYIDGLTWRNPLADRRPRLWLAYASVKTQVEIVAFVRRFGPMVGEDLAGGGKRVELRHPRDDGHDYYGATVASCLSAAKRLRDQRDLWRRLRGEMDRAEARGDMGRPEGLRYFEHRFFDPLEKVHMRLEWSDRRRAFVPLMVPASLEVAAWAQFSQAVAGNVGLKPCERCGGLFELDPKQTRNDRKFCSNACKQAAWRESRAAGSNS
jgi:hypothetical protein